MYADVDAAQKFHARYRLRYHVLDFRPVRSLEDIDLGYI